MRPADVPDEWVDDAVEVWHATAGTMLLDDQMRAIIAAVLPAHEVNVRAALSRELTDLAGGMRDVGAQIEIDGDPVEAAVYEDGAQHLDSVAQMIRGEGLNAIPPIRWSRS